MSTAPAGGAPVPVPTWARTHLAHAALEVIARDAGCDVLHVKGPAAHPRLRPNPYQSSDADLLVRPSHVDRFMAALDGHGWSVFAHFDWGSAFRHAASLRHDSWGNVDIHRFYPGLGADVGGRRRPEAAFDVLYADRTTIPIAGIDCRVPNETGQALVLLLHDARASKDGLLADTRRAWTEATDAQRDEIRRLARRTGSEVALAAAIDELEHHRDSPDYLMWRHFREGGSRLDEWRARIAAERGPWGKAREAARALRVNRDHLAMEKGHEPTRHEIAVEAGNRYAAAARAVAGVLACAARRGVSAVRGSRR